MNDCKRVSDLFGALHDEQLEGEIAESVRQHLSMCSECRDDFKWYGFTVHALAGLEEMTPPRDFLAQFHARFDAAKPAPFFESFRNILTLIPHFPLPVGVTALAIMTVVGLSLYNYGPMYAVQTAASGYSSPTVSEKAPSAKGVVPLMARTHENALSSGARPVASYPFRALPAVQDRIGTDMLTVESPSVDRAIESLKKILPGIQGKVLEEQNGQIGGTLLTVVIPPQAYGNLTTELVNHGAVAVGPKTQNGSSTADPGAMRLHIHFVRSR
jgi:hypothetical protein